MTQFESQLLVGAAAGLVAAIVTSALSLTAVWWGLEHQRKAATTQDKRNLRDARSARTRKSLSRLLAVAMQIQLVADGPILTDAPMREELQKLRDELGAMWPKMRRNRAQVLSEPDGLKWMTEFEDQVLRPFREFQNAGKDEKDSREELATLKAGVAKFQADVAAHFASLDEPI
jgi:hypothetical protein